MDTNEHKERSRDGTKLVIEQRFQHSDIRVYLCSFVVSCCIGLVDAPGEAVWVKSCVRLTGKPTAVANGLLDDQGTDGRSALGCA